MLATLLLSTVGCSVRSTNADDADIPVIITRGLPQRELSVEELREVRDELVAQACPEDCNPAVYAELRDSLLQTIEIRIAQLNGDTAKSAAKLPDQARNTVDDAQVVSDGAGGFNLTWTYRNVGDYSGDGEVNISDLTPLGVNLNKDSNSPDWATAQAADGDANGAVTISDLTPIGANLFSQISGYNLYRSDTEGGPWATLGSVELADASSEYPHTFSFALGAAPPAFILISARDAGGLDWQGGPDALPAEVNLDNDVPLATQTITTNGGFISGPTGSPLEGYNLFVPTGAFAVDTEVTLGYNDGSITPVLGELVGPIIELSTDYGQEFEQLLEITVPHTGGAEDVAIPFYITEEGTLEYCEITAHGTGFVTFGTYHASDFAVILARANNPLADFYDTKFDPEKHGFQIPNHSSEYNYSGEAFGMAAFAQWHYQGGHGNLYPQYMDFFPDTSLPRQSVIATRAHIAVSRVWDNYVPEVKWQRNSLSDEQEWLLLQYTMVNSRRPILVVMGPPEAPSHVVLAYAVVGNDLFVYDPDYPTQSKVIKFNEPFFGEYRGFTQFMTIGHGMVNTGINGALEPKENFSRVLYEVLNSPTPDAVVDSEFFGTDSPNWHADISLLVTHSGTVPIDKVVLTSEGRTYSASAQSGGLFEFDNVFLKDGPNYFYIKTIGTSAQGKPLDIRNNFSNTRGFLIIGNHPAASAIVELFWDNSVAPEPYDMDFALQGNGVTINSARGPMTDQYGGEVSNAAINSGGPDLYILEPGDSIPWGQLFDIRVRKSTFNSNKTKYKLRVIVNGKVVYYLSDFSDYPGNPEPLDPPPHQGPSGGWDGAAGFHFPPDPSMGQ